MKKNRKIKSFLILMLVCVLSVFMFVSKKASGDDKMAELILFYAPGCPHCHHAMEFLEKIEKNYPDLKIIKYNTATKTGVNYYFHYTKKLGIDSKGVPLAVFGEKYELGFGDDNTTGKKYIEYIEEMINKKNIK